MRRPIPAAAAMSSPVVSSKPRAANKANAVCSSSSREVTRLRPGWRSAIVCAGTRITVLAGSGDVPFYVGARGLSGDRASRTLISGTWCRYDPAGRLSWHPVPVMASYAGGAHMTPEASAGEYESEELTGDELLVEE